MILALNRTIGGVTIGELLAIALGGYLLFITLKRLMSDDDPTFSLAFGNRLGAVTFLSSGAFLSLMVAGLIAWLTWPLPRDRGVFGLFLVGIVVAHAVVEWRER